MDITKFVELSLGCWRSQRSAHHLGFSYFEQVISTIEIESLELDDPQVINLCNSHKIAPQLASFPFKMSWEGESDWDDNEVVKGSTILVPIPDSQEPNKGRLLREQGYAETIPAVGNYHFNDDGTFVLLTNYERATAEEKIWFVTPNLRCRVSFIKTSDGNGVTTASFASEIRSLSTKT
jgi:phycoerythrin-associated linker protein